MNILYGKFGRNICFNPEKWSTVGGDNDAPTLLLTMAKLHPEDTFYMIQNNDFNKMGLKEKYPNIVSLYDGWSRHYDNHTYLYDKIQRLGIKIDYCIMWSGIASTMNIEGMKYRRNDGTIKEVIKTLEFTKRYCAAQIYLLNSMKSLKWMLLSPDPRLVPLKMLDLFNAPEIVLSQINGSMPFTYRDLETSEKITTKIPVIYSGLENIFLFGKKRPPRDLYISHKTTDKINIVLNQGNSYVIKRTLRRKKLTAREPTIEEITPINSKEAEYIANGGSILISRKLKSGSGFPRYEELKAWVLDNLTEHTKTTSIYGKWDEFVMVDQRFKGEVRIEKLKNLLFNTTYTFVIPIDVSWATAKFAEMCYYGIIPFMHPMYDSQRNIKCPEFLRPQTIEEFKERVEYLDAHPEKITELRTQLWELYGDDVYSGESLINNYIYPQINGTIGN